MKLTYRPEIDGLRAIAVVAVIFYHAKISILGHEPFKGGFIGVDIFFVISGYLITSIILKELVTTGSFSFKHFYERRIRRILPALLFVMLMSLPFAWMYLLPSSFVDFSKSILYSLGFSSNFYFHYSGQEYAAETGLLKPFLHTWSLSVEEQYYILFPIVLLITFKYFRKYLIHILILGFFTSLGLAEWGSRNHPSFNFYVLPTRGWELLAGSILAYLEITRGYRSKNKSLNLILPIVGIILILYSIVFFNDDMFHPSFYTLLPIIGVCLIIWYSNKDDFIKKLLSTRLFVGIGLISYSLYLWHYPIFAFGRIALFKNEFINLKYIFIIIIFFISYFSFTFVEKPFRKKSIGYFLILKILSILFFVIIIFNLFIVFKNGQKERLPRLISDNIDQTYYFLKNKDGESCHPKELGCFFDRGKNKNIIAVGDSVMASLTYDLMHKVSKKDFNFIHLTNEGCFFFYGMSKKNNQNCNSKYYEKLLRIISDERNSILILSGRYQMYLENSFFNNLEGGNEENKWGIWNQEWIADNGKDTLETSFRDIVNKLSINKKIILVYPIPEVGWDLPMEIQKTFYKNINDKNYFKQKENFITTSFEVFKKRTHSSFELLDSIENENIYRVFPHTLFCNTIIFDRCLTHDDKNIFFMDPVHPSSKGAEMINDLIMKEIEKIELKSN